MKGDLREEGRVRLHGREHKRLEAVHEHRRVVHARDLGKGRPRAVARARVVRLVALEAGQAGGHVARTRVVPHLAPHARARDGAEAPAVGRGAGRDLRRGKGRAEAKVERRAPRLARVAPVAAQAARRADVAREAARRVDVARRGRRRVGQRAEVPCGAEGGRGGGRREVSGAPQRPACPVRRPRACLMCAQGRQPPHVARAYICQRRPLHSPLRPPRRRACRPAAAAAGPPARR